MGYINNGGIFSGYWSLLALYLSPPVRGLVLDPLAVYTSTTVYISVVSTRLVSFLLEHDRKVNLLKLNKI